MTDTPQEIPEWPEAGEPTRDGIGEEDNAIPLWFNVGFYGLIVFGIVYILWFELTGWTQSGVYDAAVVIAEERAAAQRATLPSTNPYRGDEAALAQGAETWRTVCVACHLPEGTGLVGPSLVDAYWKYGNSDEELFATVAEGRPAGMPPWGPQLGTEKIWKVLAYMETLPKTAEPGLGSPDYRPPGAPGGTP